ncbi:hypothetical protein AgCh_031924 [Apium graveolens]
MELQHQTLIYKYITANSPVPSNLPSPIRKALNSAGFSIFPGSYLRPDTLGWGAFHLGFSNNTDPKTGQCRRTDGKKCRSYLNNKNVDEKLQDGTRLYMLSSNIGLKENQFLTQKRRNQYQEPSRSEFGLVCSDSLLYPFQKRTSMISYDSSKDIMDSQNKSQLYLLVLVQQDCSTASTLMAILTKLDLNTGSSVDITNYRDADFAGCKIGRKSTSGSCQFLGGRLVSWYIRKQKSISTSTAEAEYIAAGSCYAQILWMKNQLLDYGLDYSSIVINCDNQSAIAMIGNPVQHSMTKHISIRYHFISEHVEAGTLELIFVPTDQQVADIFTKPLCEATFTRLVHELGMISGQFSNSDS